jgi:hypothetical protein
VYLKVMKKFLREPMKITSYSPFSGAIREITFSHALTIILLESGTFRVKFWDYLKLKGILFVLVGINLIH